jgi:hypothetical protein
MVPPEIVAPLPEPSGPRHRLSIPRRSSRAATVNGSGSLRPAKAMRNRGEGRAQGNRVTAPFAVAPAALAFSPIMAGCLSALLLSAFKHRHPMMCFYVTRLPWWPGFRPVSRPDPGDDERRFTAGFSTS